MEEETEEQIVRRKKLGDFAEQLLKPIVKVIDKQLGTDLKNCGGCKRRKAMLNKLDDTLTKPFDD